MNAALKLCLLICVAVEGLQTGRTLTLAPALLLTTADSISLVYPKEMGYAKDFLHTIYKINNNNRRLNEPGGEGGSNHSYRIEDAVYDNRTWSIYVIVSNSSGGSEIVRLTHLIPYYSRRLSKHANHTSTKNQ